jgi:HEAT repeat protein
LDKTPSEKIPNFSEELIQDCLTVMESGDIEDLFEIIPRIGVLRDNRFHQPLLRFLDQNDMKKAEFAAYAMGAMGNREFLDPLKNAFLRAHKLKSSSARDFLIAVIEAVGALGDDAAVDFFLPILEKGESHFDGEMLKWIVESLGAIAQQGGERSIQALIEVTHHRSPELKAYALSELSVAYWHRPNEIEESTIRRIIELTNDKNEMVAESAVSALQSLADVGCRRAERLFLKREE